MGFDLGTSAVKGVLLSAAGRVLAGVSAPTALRSPRAGWCEFDAAAFVATVLDLMRQLGAACPAGHRVAGVAFAAASGNSLLTDAAGQPLAPAISWTDDRARGLKLAALDGVDLSGVHGVTGWPYLESFPLAHLAWLKEHRPELYRGAAHYTLDTVYLLHRLTGRWGVDPSTATPSYLLDQVAGKWHAPYLAALGIPAASLPELRPSGTVLGGLTAVAAEATGLSCDTRVVLGCFDHPAAARATGTLAPGDLMFSCGTSWVGFYPVADRAAALAMGMLVDPFLQPAGPWGAMFALTRMGQTIDALVERAVGPMLAGDDPQARFRRFDALAESAPRGAGGLCLDLMRADAAEQVPAGVAPALLSRAVMEAAAFHMRAKVEELAAAGWRPRRLTMVGGPSRSAVWSRVLADVTGLPFYLGVRQNAGAIGAAILAGIGTGVFADVQAGAAAVAAEPEIVRPDPIAHDQYTRLFAEWKAKSSCK